MDLDNKYCTPISVAEDKKSVNEVPGSTNPAPEHAPTQLRSSKYKLPVHPPSVKDPYSSNDDMIIKVLDGNVLPASNDALEKNTDVRNNKINKFPVSSMRKFAMRRAKKKHRIFDSSHGAKMHPTSASGSSKGKHRFVFPSTPPSSGTDEPFKTQIKTDLKLIISPTKETIAPPTDTIDTDSEWISEKGDATDNDKEKSSQSDQDDSQPDGQPTVTEQQESTPHGGTTSIPLTNVAVYPGMKESEGLRWKVVYDNAKSDEDTNGKRVKIKRKKSHSTTEEEAQSGSPSAILAGVLAAILMIFIIFNGVPRLR